MDAVSVAERTRAEAPAMFPIRPPTASPCRWKMAAWNASGCVMPPVPLVLDLGVTACSAMNWMSVNYPPDCTPWNSRMASWSAPARSASCADPAIHRERESPADRRAFHFQVVDGTQFWDGIGEKQNCSQTTLPSFTLYTQTRSWSCGPCP